jgi:hypothetical protein
MFFKKKRRAVGESIEEAIVIEGVPSGFLGVAKEYWHLKEMFGEQDKDWKLKNREMIRVENREIEKMNIELEDGTLKSIHFDITSFYGME